jgi:hypothetical protein
MSLATTTPTNLSKANAQQNGKSAQCSSQVSIQQTMNSIASYAVSTRARALKRFKGKSCRTPHSHAKSASSPYKTCVKRSQIHSKYICLTQFTAMVQGVSA